MPHPGEIISHMRHAYQQCQRYSDEGKVFVNGLKVGTFETVFRRAKAFIEFSFRWSVGSQAGASCRYLTIKDELVALDVPELLSRAEPGPDRLGSAIAMLTGVTFGAAYMIPRLLIPGLGGVELWPSKSADVMIVTEGEEFVRLRMGGVLLDIESSTFKILRHAFGEQSVTVYRAQLV